jgi:hypothetical protein
MLIAIPSFAFAQTSGAGGAGVGNSDSSAGAAGNVHSGANAPAQTGPSRMPYEGRSSSAPLPPQNKVGDKPSSSESVKGNTSAGAHDSE